VDRTPDQTPAQAASASQSTADGPPVLSVSALNQAVGRLLERSFPLTWVAGEISNFTRAASGHWYFTLKDDGAQVRAVMFRGRAQYAGFIPREGDRVEVRALVTLYTPRGDYQLNVEAIRQAGLGNLYEAFLRLKEKLGAEGLFDPARKRPLPRFARTIGIVTSPQAAALRDILTTLARRAPHVRVILYPTPVQGEGAAEKIVQALQRASARAECELLLLCRGGGSIEDLWSFNHESVARAIVACPMPVIAGVGHETDFTIADFAADLRAPTPTAAAEMAAIARNEWIAALLGQAGSLTSATQRHLGGLAQTLDWHWRRLVSPSALIANQRLRLDGIWRRQLHAAHLPVNQARLVLMGLDRRLGAHLPDTGMLRSGVLERMQRMRRQAQHGAGQRRHRLAALAAQLEMLNPQRTLERGYAIATDSSGRILRAPDQLQARQTIRLRLAKGSADIGIQSVQPTLD